MNKKNTLVTVFVFLIAHSFGQENTNNLNQFHNDISILQQNSNNKNINTGKHNKFLNQNAKRRIYNTHKLSKSGKQRLDSLVSYDEKNNPLWKENYTYDSIGNNTQKLESSLSSITKDWYYTGKSDYSYDSNCNITQKIYYDWNFSTIAWEISRKYIYTYDSIGNNTQEIVYYWDSNINDWWLSSRFDYTYNLNGNETLEVEYEWYLNEWNFNRKTEYTYDTNYNYTLTIDYEWKYGISDWIAYRKSEYTYDSNNNRIQEIRYEKSLYTNDLVQSSKINFNYNKTYTLFDLIMPFGFNLMFKNMLIDADNYSWDLNINDWINDGEIILYYSEYTTSIFNNNPMKFNVFPNPFSDNLIFSFPYNNNNISIELFNMQGYKVLTKKIKNNESIDLKFLSKGMYFYNLNFDNKKYSNKIIKSN